jgi:hypothetical protein
VNALVWERLGDVRNYVEPFFGSGAILLGRPHMPRVETVNDKDCYLANFWRAVQHDPEQVAFHADSPVNEADLHARHRWLVESAGERVEAVMSDPDYFDAKVAGWWVWGQCLWIGSGWCMKPEWTGRGHFDHSARGIHANGTSGEKVLDWNVRPDLSSPNQRGALVERASSMEKKRPVLSHGGEHRALRHGDHDRPQKLRADSAAGRTDSLCDRVQSSAEEASTPRKRRALTRKGEGGVGVHRVSLTRQIDDLSGDDGAVGRGIHASGFVQRTGGLYEYMGALSDRLRRVCVCCGDWKRVIGPAVTTCISITGLFLDPPYHAPGTERSKVYNHDDDAIWREVKDWAVANGDNPELRIALCGYEGDHGIPSSWSEVAWKSAGGYGSSARGQANRERERIWFSPHCLSVNAVQHSLDFAPEVA